ncbi:F-box protein At3g07870-like [Aegilops tauschii subsp. strangulata]|uniref:F-box protein At3g07870-like n=1 Tax=Aegilops tauschii subsp. strangulata TaxID=200361 RepID=UPI000989B04A|nr:F-box protein At3g07870-like [Aegilops tauschii subsp. strangulata]
MELPPDVLVSIVQRLPPSSRRLTRLVCRQWRDVVDTRTAEMQSRAKLLVTTPAGSAYFASDLYTGRPGRYLWKNNARHYKGIMVVGTCNGLICLCDNREASGVITLVNPATAERLPLPPLPSHATVRDFTVRSHERYGFGYHPTTGRHKVVHVGDYGRKGNPQVNVFTLGEASWRDVATAPGPRCDYEAHIVGVDGTMYWAAKRGKKLMAFDLDCERLTFIKSLPEASSNSWHLAAVLGRLGILFFHERIQKCEKSENLYF